MNNYLNYKKDIHSQNGEDGVVEAIFEKLQIDSGYLCEFGANDGIYLSNTYHIYEHNSNYTPILIESSKELYNGMVTNLSHIENKFCIHCSVSQLPDHKNSLDNILKSLNIEDLQDNFNLLSIDIDGYDYDVWKNFGDFRPKVVIIEVNSAYPPDQKVYPCQPSGASAGIMVELATKKGYELICHTGNLFFITKELYHKLNIENNDLEHLFLKNWL